MAYSHIRAKESSEGGASLDDFLGPASERYLASRFRHVSRSFIGSVSPSGRHQLDVKGRALLAYPEAWTVKTGVQPIPHLSSIDAVVLTEALCSNIAEKTAGSSAAPPRMRSISLRAGTSADVELETVPVTGTLSAAGSATKTEARLTIGGMRVVAHLDHLPVATHTDVEKVDPFSVALTVDCATERVWNSRLVSMDVDRGIAFAHEVALDDDGPGWIDVTILDLLRLSAQQAQALIYCSDELDRASANGIWMRNAHFDLGHGEPAAEPVRLAVSIARTQRIDRGSARWNVFDVVAHGTGGLRASASLAYRSR